MSKVAKYLRNYGTDLEKQSLDVHLQLITQPDFTAKWLKLIFTDNELEFGVVITESLTHTL